MADLVDPMKYLRALESRPEWKHLWRMIAQEVVSTGVDDDANILDAGFRLLQDSQREAFLESQANSLAVALGRATIVWATMEAEFAEDWLKRQSDDGG